MLIRAGIAALCLLICPAQAFPQGTPDALLWQITDPEGSPRGYLYGTIHSQDARAYTYSQAVISAMEGVSTVAGELDFQQAEAGVLALMSAMMLPDGKELMDLYRKRDRPMVEQGMNERFGATAGMFMRMKPFFIMAILGKDAMGSDHPEVLDEFLLEHARSSGQRVIGLETMAEQLRAMDVLPLKEQAAMLLAHFRNGTYLTDLDDMLNAYAAQDLDALAQLAVHGGGMPGKLQTALVTERNRVMTHRIDSVLQADGSAMFLIGAAHLPGEEGVLELLRVAGYHLEPLAIELTSSQPLLPPGSHLTEGIRYTDRERGISVDLPGLPHTTDDENGSGWMVFLEGPYDEMLVYLGLDDHDPAGPEPDLDGLMDEDFPVDEIIAVAKVEVQGMPARRISFHSDVGPSHGLIIQRDHVVYVLVVATTDADSAKLVLDSFRFTDLPE